MSSMNETKGLKALMIIEVIGRPPEHLIEALEEIIKKIDNEKGASVLSKKINEPTLMKDQKDFYTTFGEIEVEVEEIMILVALMFRYMPAHVEVLEPEFIVLANNGWNEILNELVRKLHGYDEIAGLLKVEKAALQKKLNELTPKEEKKDLKVENDIMVGDKEKKKDLKDKKV